MELDAHGEVGDESSFGDLDIEANALGFGTWIDHRAPDGGVSEARCDPALHLVALDSDVISTDGLWWCEGMGFQAEKYDPVCLQTKNPDSSTQCFKGHGLDLLLPF